MVTDRKGYDEKLQIILRTAAGIFAEKGYHQASIRDISRATGISLSGLYYYFESKEELLFLIQEHTLVTLLELVERVLTESAEPLRRLQLLIQQYLGFFGSNMAEMKVLSHEADSLTGELHDRLRVRKRRITEVAREILNEANPESDLDDRVSVFALFGMMNWLYTWYRPQRDVPIERLGDDVFRLFAHGYLHTGPRPPHSPRGSATDLQSALWGPRLTDG